MEAERNSTDSIPDIEMAETNPSEELIQTNVINQLDCVICFFDILFLKSVILIVIILNFIVPPVFIDFYYGIQAIEENQYTQWELYFFCNGIVYSLLAFISIVAIASVSDVNAIA